MFSQPCLRSVFLSRGLYFQLSACLLASLWSTWLVEFIQWILSASLVFFFTLHLPPHMKEYRVILILMKKVVQKAYLPKTLYTALQSRVMTHVCYWGAVFSDTSVSTRLHWLSNWEGSFYIFDNSKINSLKSVKESRRNSPIFKAHQKGVSEGIYINLIWNQKADLEFKSWKRPPQSLCLMDLLDFFVFSCWKQYMLIVES